MTWGPKCPRCGQTVELRVKAGTIKTIKAHRDLLTRASCPTGGMLLDEARSWVERARQAIREMSR